MAVDYDRARCVEFVQDFFTEPPADRTIGMIPVSFGQSLLHAYGLMVYGDLSGLPLREHHARLFAEFRQMSLWNQQGVLYQMVPRFEEFTKLVASHRCKEAREHEPL